MKVSDKTLDRNAAEVIAAAQKYSDLKDRVPPPPKRRRRPATLIDDMPQRPPLERAPPGWFDPGYGEQQPEHGDHSGVLIDNDLAVSGNLSSKDGAVYINGSDALAYYAPFHFYKTSVWGIYIPDSSLVYLASAFLNKKVLSTSDSWALRLAYATLWRHEYFHFQAELATTNLELIFGDRNIYRDNFFDRKVLLLEEALANACALDYLQSDMTYSASYHDVKFFIGCLARWMKSQPEGYRDYDKWLASQGGVLSGLDNYSKQLQQNFIRSRRRGTMPPSNVIDIFLLSNFSKVPVYRIHDIPGVLRTRPFPRKSGVQVITHSNDHEPPHIHVFFDGESFQEKVLWDSLTQYGSGKPLSKYKKESLEQYLGTFGEEINSRLKKIYKKPNDYAPDWLRRIHDKQFLPAVREAIRKRQKSSS